MKTKQEIKNVLKDEGRKLNRAEKNHVKRITDKELGIMTGWVEALRWVVNGIYSHCRMCNNGHIGGVPCQNCGGSGHHE